MAVGTGVMPNGRNKFGGRKPAMPATSTGKGVDGSPPAGSPKNGTLPGPDKSIDSCYGTHVGSAAHMGTGAPVARRTIATDAK